MLLPPVTILSVVGTRPNFMKAAPLHRAFSRLPGLVSKLVHTGQHYDNRMSDVFFRQLGLPEPDYHLGVGSGSQTQQTAEIMTRFENVLLAEQPDLVLVVGDVTSTLACALAARQRGIRVAHVEAGLRSGDRQMPEETNRILTDHLADLLFVTEPAGVANLKREGIPDDRIHFVGNVMIDALVHARHKASQSNTVEVLNQSPGEYALMTMHRPANVDTRAGLLAVGRLLVEAARHKTVLVPLHPRTRQNLLWFGLLDEWAQLPNVLLLEPLGYLEFLNLLEHAAFVLTDSGGVQEEATYLRVPCLTFRSSTERPITITLGTNQLLPDLCPKTLRIYLKRILDGQSRPGSIPPLWDGQAADRIAGIIRAQIAPLAPVTSVPFSA